jgi:cyclophilin family peptidyl-prolyl cis-trans isomerase
MKTLITVIYLSIISLAAVAQTSFVELTTDKGKIVIMLYDKTPQHKKMFLNEIKKGTYTGANFNRVIKDFVSQGGGLDDPILAREKLQPESKPRRLPAEIDSTLIHKRGALGAGRDDNPTKSSYYNQIYLVSGKVLTNAELDALEVKKGIKIPTAAREVYKTNGGIPRLDNDYTIFGEVVQGLDIAEQINNVATDKSDQPITPIIFNLRALSKKEIKALRI